MLFLDKDPTLCATATPFVLSWNIINNFEVAWKKVCGASDETLLPKTLSACIEEDLKYSSANVKWYELYINELISMSNELRPNKNQKPLLVLHSNNVQSKNSCFDTNPLKIHSPEFDENYLDIIEEDKKKYWKARKDPIAFSRLLLMDMKPQFEDFPRGVPSWLLEISPREVVSGYDSVNRRHIKIERTPKGLKYYTSVISDSWKEIENVPREMDLVVQYILSNRANLTLVD